MNDYIYRGSAMNDYTVVVVIFSRRNVFKERLPAMNDYRDSRL